MTPTTAPYGTWSSPISAADVAEGGVRLHEPWLEGEVAYWLELRPAEDGRSVLVRAEPFGSPVDVTPAGFDVRTRVHEYGGGSYTVFGETVFVSNDADQRLYRQDGGGEPHPITPEPPAPRSIRYADGRVTPDGRRLVCVRERHDDAGVTNELVALPADGSSEPVVIASGADFYAAPRPSPNGRSLAYLSWSQPLMPWDGTELHVADLTEGGLERDRVVAGGERESIFQPEWSDDGVLHFVSDRTEWWNVYRLAEPDGRAENLTPREAEFGVPMWEFGHATYAFLDDGRIACIYRAGGEQHLAVLDPTTRELVDLDLPFRCFDPGLHASGPRLLFVAGGGPRPQAVVALDFTSRAVDVLRVERDLRFDASYVSTAEPIAFATGDGAAAYGFFYPPTNPSYEAPEGERPPLIVMSHGGPTGETTPELHLGIHFFTSRGFGVVDVNYRGSTGYGRAYREALYGRWGIVDVEDCVSAARFLVERGDADADRLAITGGSAGGYTTICALAWTDVFAAGASYYGLADLEPFATSTHKFELRYADVLVGPWPEARETWRERSPIHAFDRISCPVIVLQGLEDEVVPPEQAEIMVDALRANGLPYAYLAFEGEQHGFRKAETIRRALESELSFYAQVLGFELGDPIEPVVVENLR